MTDNPSPPPNVVNKPVESSVSPANSGPEQEAVNPENFQYASFGKRFLAALIDGILVGLVTGAISTATGGGVNVGEIGAVDPAASAVSSLVSLLNLVISYGYFIYFTGSSGQTLGKRAMSIKVVDMETGQAPGYIPAGLRETVGKLLSSILLLGYLNVLWDKKKQGWHDKIAKTVVIKT